MPADHAALMEIRDACRRNRVVCIPNLYLSEENARFDASPVRDADGSLLGITKMVHIVQAPCFYERDYYDASDAGWKVFDTAAGKIGVVICFDRHDPESFRACLLQGAEIVIVPTANHEREDLELFECEVRVAAMQNNVYVAMCNRVGREGDLVFAGRSLVADPQGTILARADDRERLLYADLNFEEILKSRERRPFHALRRPQFYPDTSNGSES
jgi:N-carbamoylputrescine amidase